jgi:SAM-dependent methyltransferase
VTPGEGDGRPTVRDRLESRPATLSAVSQQAIDRRNAEFWDELCGSGLARQLGVTDASPESLRRFDEGYLSLYPYLHDYIPKRRFNGKKVLEIGLGYGTLGQLLASRGADYYGVDIAPGPVAMMEERLRRMGKDLNGRVLQASALELPFAEGMFDYVYTIGCLHHTGDIPASVSEVHRVLRPSGIAVVMLYNAHSFRQVVHVSRMRRRLRDRRTHEQRVRALYDTNEAGEAAPHTDYVSRRDARRLFRRFSKVKIDSRNFDSLVFLPGRYVLLRERLLGNLDRLLGLDLYVTAVK